MIKCKYFTIKELVSPIVYGNFGEGSWMFFTPDVLSDLDTIREAWGSPIIINNWANGGNLKQCGLRCNMDDIVKKKKSLYLSAHLMGKAFDLHDAKGNNVGLWNLCKRLISENKLKAFNRLENLKNAPTWTHIDAFQGNMVF